MLGALDTTRKPLVAPAGSVKRIEVSLQELTVTGAPFNNTTLAPCAVPKLEPVIVTWLPIAPVVADRVLINGAGDAVELTDTLSNVAVSSVLVDWLLTAKPI
jgi:hypothetical protein